MGTCWPWCLCPDLFRGTGNTVLPSSSQLTFCEPCGGVHSHTRVCALQWGPPIPRPRTRTCPWPVRNLMTQQELSGRWASEASSVFAATLSLELLPKVRKTSSGLPLILHYGELYNYSYISQCIIIIIEIKCTIKIMCLNHPETIPCLRLWKNCLPWHRSLVLKGWRLLLYRVICPLQQTLSCTRVSEGSEVWNELTEEGLWGAR